jgi:hypothetical protein
MTEVLLMFPSEQNQLFIERPRHNIRRGSHAAFEAVLIEVKAIPTVA